MVQVISYKLTGKEFLRWHQYIIILKKKGWPESTVVIRFWIISIILAMIGLATLKIKIMNGISNIFINKKILIYGLGKTGLSSSNFLKKKIRFFCMMIIEKFYFKKKKFNFKLKS